MENVKRFMGPYQVRIYSMTNQLMERCEFSGLGAAKRFAEARLKRKTFREDISRAVIRGVDPVSKEWLIMEFTMNEHRRTQLNPLYEKGQISRWSYLYYDGSDQLLTVINSFHGYQTLLSSELKYFDAYYAVSTGLLRGDPMDTTYLIAQHENQSYDMDKYRRLCREAKTNPAAVTKVGRQEALIKILGKKTKDE